MHAGLARFWSSALGKEFHPSDEWRARFDTAVMEIAGNILRHAYPPGHKPGNVKLRLRLYADRAEALLTDRGIPFEEPAVASPDADADPLDLPEGGYGLAIARAAVDRLEYSRRARGANRWQLVKKLEKGARRQGSGPSA